MSLGLPVYNHFAGRKFFNQDTRGGYQGVWNCSIVMVIGHVNNIPTMHFFTGISRNTQSKSYMLSLTECVWDFQNNALWDTH